MRNTTPARATLSLIYTGIASAQTGSGAAGRGGSGTGGGGLGGSVADGGGAQPVELPSRAEGNQRKQPAGVRSLRKILLAISMLGCALTTSACVTGNAGPSSGDFKPGATTQSLGDPGENAP